MAKRTAKNSVFLDLFQNKSYLLKLYKTLHPEDTTATEDSLTDVTITNVLTDNLYNDLGFIVNGKLMILIEAQSTWTMNILVRVLLYLAQREKEVVTIMMSLFDEEQIMESFIRSERHDEARETAERMIKMGKLSLEEIALCVPSVSLDELKEIEAEVMQLA